MCCTEISTGKSGSTLSAIAGSASYLEGIREPRDRVVIVDPDDDVSAGGVAHRGEGSNDLCDGREVTLEIKARTLVALEALEHLA